MSFKLSNYSKGTPKKWQIIGDLALVLIPVFISIVNESPLTPEDQMTVNFYLSSILAIIKVVTQFFGEETE